MNRFNKPVAKKEIREIKKHNENAVRVRIFVDFTEYFTFEEDPKYDMKPNKWYEIDVSKFGLTTPVEVKIVSELCGDGEIIPNIGKMSNMKKVFDECEEGDFAMLFLKPYECDMEWILFLNLISTVVNTNAALTYTNYISISKEFEETEILLQDCLIGSVRNDFDFGDVVVLNTDKCKPLLDKVGDCEYSAFYGMALRIDRDDIMHLETYSYNMFEIDERESGEKQFDYVDPRNSKVQKEYEDVFTAYLNEIGCLKDIENWKTNLSKSDVARDETVWGVQKFKYKMSVIIPVKNRVDTIADAIHSAINQETSAKRPYNVIVVDNHSTDGTTELLMEMTRNKDLYGKLVHIIPKRTDLGIGGCWMEAINSPYCGEFAVQLDSDDVYDQINVLEKISRTLESEDSEMLIGSYLLTDLEQKPLSNNLIDHKEWTRENGINNALRINGLGAPRVFYTPALRALGIPNVSYGEDYATVLSLGYAFTVSRIYDCLYNCRRWSGNSDSNLSPIKVTTNNDYKDSLRTIDILRRKKIRDFLKDDNSKISDN